ncbi:MAG: rhodanese-like domain-containing protein [Chthoniobacteraceae bacterium]
MTPATQTTVPTISPAEAARRKDGPGAPVLLDVRTPLEYSETHIPGSRLIPLDELDAAALAREVNATDGCIVFCRSGSRARKAADQLASAGLENVTVVEGGVSAWEAAGLPVTKGAKVMSLERQVRIAAGGIVLVGVLLAHFIHPAFIWLAGFVGAGLMFAGITDWCGMGLLIARMPWNRRAGACCKTEAAA